MILEGKITVIYDLTLSIDPSDIISVNIIKVPRTVRLCTLLGAFFLILKTFSMLRSFSDFLFFLDGVFTLDV